MQYVIGIDGGGTKTKLTLSDMEGNVLETAVSGPSNILSSGYDVAKQSIQEVIEEGVVKAGYRLEDCEALCIGVAGAAREAIKSQLETIIQETGYTNKMIITHDAETALMGGTAGEEGILIIAGTGAICFGKTCDGKSARVSGWGHIIGDEGSAYSIGIQILNAVMKAYDGRLPQTILTKLLLEKMGIQTEEEVIGAIYNPHVTKQHIASYAVLIDEAAKKKDEVALKIIEQTAYDLFETVSAGIVKLGFQEKPVKVVVNGSVLTHNVVIYERFKALVTRSYTQAQVGMMLHDASYGAVLLAIQGMSK